ncbi:MAG TPA: tyrosine-type recombinase/integrase [Terracidiphilus sp.]
MQPAEAISVPGESIFRCMPGAMLLKAQIGDFSWHCSRHTFARRLVMAGVALKAVQELKGHKTIQMTARYAHLSPDHPQSAVELISGVKPAKQPLEKQTATGTKTATRKGRPAVS